MPVVVENSQVDAVMVLRGNAVLGGLDREEVQDRCRADETRRAPISMRDVGNAASRRDRRLIGVGRERDIGSDPIRTDIIALGRRHVLEFRHPEFRRETLPATLSPVA